MKFKLTIFICIILLGGCQVNTYNETVPLDGHLTTPDGKFEFEQLSSDKERRKYRISPSVKPFSTITAGNENLRITFTPFISVSTIKFISKKQNANLTIDTQNTFYQINGGTKEKWILSKISYPIQIGFVLYYENPTAYFFQDLDISSMDQMREVSGNVRYYLPFTLDGDKYVMDVEVEIKKNREFEFGLRGIPGMP